ncbi:MAG: PDZ domain-containing protein [Candidatus Dadabacteria bacterium]|nr:MAG: PDZ domain-containing protein [Candidatus Dadabacteria bacterium]
MKGRSILHIPFFVAIGILLGIVFSTAYRDALESRSTSPYTDEELEVMDAYDKTHKAVVFIATINVSFDPYVGVTPKRGTGSGVIIDSKKGIIITNFHVIEDATDVEVALSDGSVYKAKLLGIDRYTDIAVLRLLDPPPDLVQVSFGSSSTLRVGQRVIAIGNPFGLNSTLTTGSISSLNRSVKRPDGVIMRGLIQTDAAINEGNSGGPLLDMKGRLVGINFLVFSRSGDSAGIGFAVPVDEIKAILPELIATGTVLRLNLGWVLADSDKGVVVQQVEPDSPASRAGLVPVMRPAKGGFIKGYVKRLDGADLIYAINGKRVFKKEDVDNILRDVKVGDQILISVGKIGRKEFKREVTIKPEFR